MQELHGGPAPSFFSELVADYILYGLEKVAVNISDVYDYDMRVQPRCPKQVQS